MTETTYVKTPRGRIMQGLLTALSILPLRLNHMLGRGLGWLLYRIPNRNLEIAKQNVAKCFPDMDEAAQQTFVKENLKQSAQGLTELAYLWGRSAEHGIQQIRKIHGEEHLQAALDGGEGFIFLSPHLGAWELLCSYYSTKIKCAVLYKEPKDPGIESVIVKSRARLGAELIRADAAGVRKLFKATKRKMGIAILPDQQPKAGTGEFAPFFGHQALTMVLLSRLAKSTTCPIIFTFAERLPKAAGWDLHVIPADPEIREGSLQESVAATNKMVERCVAIAPEQYQWGYKRFSIRPPGEPPFYKSKKG